MASGNLRLTRAAAPPIERTLELESASIDTRGSGRDLLALMTMLFVIAVAHIQSPLLLYNAQFGTAFRNATLQPVLAIALLGGAALWGWLAWGERPGVWRTLRLMAVGALVVYAGMAVASIGFGFNLAGAIAGVDQAVFRERLADDAPIAALESAQALMIGLEIGALIAVVILWRPWSRLAVYRRAVTKNVSPLVIAVLVLLIWEGGIALFNIQQFLLPRPTVIGATLAEIYPRLVSAGWNTFQNAFWGYAVGCGLGVLTGFAAARFIGFSRALLPIAIGINAIPIIALAPIMNNWFGGLNPFSKIAIVALMTFFPAMISTIRGLTSVEVVQMELMRSFAASTGDIFRKLRLPSALPYIFNALKVATTLAMIGAIVGEYFGGSTTGLGYRIRDDAGLFKYPEAWAAILVAALFGIAFYQVISAIERAALAWHVSFRE